MKSDFHSRQKRDLRAYERVVMKQYQDNTDNGDFYVIFTFASCIIYRKLLLRWCLNKGSLIIHINQRN